jgi:hypothetical protein
VGFFVSSLFFFITTRLIAILPKINNDINSNKKIVKNKVLLLISVYPEIIKIIIKIKYSGENEMFCLIKLRPEINIAKRIANNTKKYTALLWDKCTESQNISIELN